MRGVSLLGHAHRPVNQHKLREVLTGVTDWLSFLGSQKGSFTCALKLADVRQ